MADDEKISGLDPASALTDTDLTAVVQDIGGGVLQTLKSQASAWYTYIRTKLLAAVTVFTKNVSVQSVALSDGTNIATNASAGNVFTVTLGGDRTLSNPTDLTDGMLLEWLIKQDGTGTRLLSYGSKFVWLATGTAPTLLTAPGSVDRILAVYIAADDKLYAFKAGSGSGGGGGASELADLTDVDLTGLANGDGLYWNNSTSKWEPAPVPGTGVYDVTWSWYNKPGAGEKLVNFVPNVDLELPANLAGSVFRSDVAATSSAVFKIQKNGTDVATVTFAAAATTGTLSTQAAVSFAASDLVTVVAPASQDATLEGVGFTLRFTEV